MSKRTVVIRLVVSGCHSVGYLWLSSWLFELGSSNILQKNKTNSMNVGYPATQTKEPSEFIIKTWKQYREI